MSGLICTSCGRQNEPGSVFCAGCGAQLNNSFTPNPNAQTPNQSYTPNPGYTPNQGYTPGPGYAPNPNYNNPNTGAPYQYTGAGMQPKSSWMAVTSMILGICAVILNFILWATPVIPIIISVAALILGIIGRAQISGSNGRVGGGGMAIAGIVLGAVAVLLWIILLQACAAARDALNYLNGFSNELNNILKNY